MYLTDLRRKQAPNFSCWQYGLYIAFFPQVLAGPLVRWREIMPQFNTDPSSQYKWRSEALGLMLIVVGLCEKALLGDNLAIIANAVSAMPTARRLRQLTHGSARSPLPFKYFSNFSGYNRYGARFGNAVRHHAAAKLQCPLSGYIAAGFLAPMAHDIVPLFARLFVHPRSAATGTVYPYNFLRCLRRCRSVGCGTARV